MAGRRTSSIACGCGTVATFTAITATLRCPADAAPRSFSTSGTTFRDNV